jgi:hypothetical protein
LRVIYICLPITIYTSYGPINDILDKKIKIESLNFWIILNNNLTKEATYTRNLKEFQNFELIPNDRWWLDVTCNGHKRSREDRVKEMRNSTKKRDQQLWCGSHYHGTTQLISLLLRAQTHTHTLSLSLSLSLFYNLFAAQLFAFSLPISARQLFFISSR